MPKVQTSKNKFVQQQENKQQVEKNKVKKYIKSDSFISQSHAINLSDYKISVLEKFKTKDLKKIAKEIKKLTSELKSINKKFTKKKITFEEALNSTKNSINNFCQQYPDAGYHLIEFIVEQNTSTINEDDFKKALNYMVEDLTNVSIEFKKEGLLTPNFIVRFFNLIKRAFTTFFQKIGLLKNKNQVESDRPIKPTLDDDSPTGKDKALIDATISSNTEKQLSEEQLPEEQLPEEQLPAATTIDNLPELSKKFNTFARKKANLSKKNAVLASVMLPAGTKHADEFNESIRRLPIKLLSKIKEKLPNITDADLQKIAEIRNDPKSILGDKSEFFQDDETRYVLLKAFKLEQLSRTQFFTLMSLYNEIRSNEIIDCLPLYNEESGKLVVNDKNWDIATKSFRSLVDYSSRPSFYDTTDIKQGKHITDFDHTLKELQEEMQKCDPLDRVMFIFKQKEWKETFEHTDYLGGTTDVDTELYDELRKTLRFPIFYSKDFITVPNFTLLDRVVETIFGENTTSANLVLGASSPDDIRKGVKHNYRDIGVSFEDLEIPKVIHWGNIKYSVDVALHDIYHFFVNLQTAPSAKKLLTNAGAGIHQLADNNNVLIEKILEANKDTKLPTDTAENIEKSALALSGLQKILSYLKKSRMELNKYDFMIHDGNFSTLDEQQSTLKGILASSLIDMKKALGDHDKDHMQDFITPFNMKRICEVICSQLREQFNYLVENNNSFVDNNKVEFSQIAYQATWDALNQLVEEEYRFGEREAISKHRIHAKSEFNEYNFIVAMQACLLENYPQKKHAEDTTFLLNNNIVDNQENLNNINQQDAYGDTYLHNHINTISIEELQRAIDLGANLNIKNNQGDTVLHMLAKKKKATRNIDCVGILELLINNGINLDMQNAKGETALHCEIKNNGLSDLAKVLISSDINFTLIDNANMTAMDHVLQKSIKRFFMVDELIPNNIATLWTGAYIKWKRREQ